MNFFKTVDVGDIPIIIVFTQFDCLVEKHRKKLKRENFDVNHIDETARHNAEADYGKNYRGKIEHKFNLKSTVSFVRVGIPDAEEAMDNSELNHLVIYSTIVEKPNNESKVPMNTLPAYGIEDLLQATDVKLENGALKSLLAYAQRHNADAKLRGRIILFSKWYIYVDPWTQNLLSME